MGTESTAAEAVAQLMERNEANIRTIYDALGVYLGEYEGVLEPAELERATVIRGTCGKALRALAISRRKVSPSHHP